MYFGQYGRMCIICPYNDMPFPFFQEVFQNLSQSFLQTKQIENSKTVLNSRAQPR